MLSSLATVALQASLAIAAGSAALMRSLQQIIDPGVLRVGTDADPPPLAARNDTSASDAPDIDMAAHIAEVEIAPLTTARPRPTGPPRAPPPYPSV